MKHHAAIMVTGILHAYDSDDYPMKRITEGTGGREPIDYCNFEVRVDLYEWDGKPKFRDDGQRSRAHHRCTAWAKDAIVASQVLIGSTVTVIGEPISRKNPKTGEWRDEIKARGIMVHEGPVSVGEAREEGMAKFPDVSVIIDLGDD